MIRALLAALLLTTITSAHAAPEPIIHGLPCASTIDVDVYVELVNDPKRSERPTIVHERRKRGAQNICRAFAYLERSPHARHILAIIAQTHTRIAIVVNDLDDTAFTVDRNLATPTIYWDEYTGLRVPTGTMSPALGLAHELAHLARYLTHAPEHIVNVDEPNDRYDTREERAVITRAETPIAQDLHEPTRTNHAGLDICVSSPVSRYAPRTDGHSQPCGLHQPSQ